MDTRVNVGRPHLREAFLDEDALWRHALPRIEAYLAASGLAEQETLAAMTGAIRERLRDALPLRQDEDPVQVAMQVTARWVEDRRLAAGTGSEERITPAPAMPPPAPLEMPEQPVSLPDPPEAAPRTAPTTAGRGIALRRGLYGFLVFATTAGAIGLLSGSVQQQGLKPLELLLVGLYAVLFLWICSAFWTAFLGFVVRFFRIRRWDLDAPRPAGPLPRTAVVMPVYNETPGPVFARLRAIWESLAGTDAADHFDFFVLSDTRDADTWVAEELCWERLCRDLNAAGRIFYRNRAHNEYRKAGNLADFIRTWGGSYAYTVVLDADSLMEGGTLVRMVEIMEAHPRVALAQVPAVPVNHESLFARLLQFASSLYGPMYSAGLNFWQAGDANYWGHNAILRTEAFARHCGLPVLPGREPFGGPILSHDFVEAALLRRAGWEIWILHQLDGSYEEVPPTLIDYAKRDRRWCQGNLQHAPLIFARGWRGLSRAHFAMAVMSYLASPLWFLFLLVAGIEAWMQLQETPVYFFGYSLFPVWPVSYAFELMTVLLVTLGILFLPKVLALALLARDAAARARFGGLPRAALSVLLETLFSAVTAPVLMLYQTKFVAAILLRRTIGWPNQERDDHATSFAEALAAHGGQTLLGIAAGIIAWYYVPNFFWWFTPVLAGLLLAIPVSMLSSRADVGRAARRAGLFLSPDETAPTPVIRRYRALMEELREEGNTAPPRPWLAALLDPAVNGLHRRLLPRTKPTRRERHMLEGLMYSVIDHTPDVLDTQERRAMLSNEMCLRRTHIGLWSELPMEELARLSRLASGERGSAAWPREGAPAPAAAGF